MDLNKIALYGTADGQLAQEPQRVVYSLCDGIIGGEGDGPLNSQPLPLGVLSLTNHSGMNDIAMATLLGMDPERLPMLQEAARLQGRDKVRLTWNCREISLDDLRPYRIKTQPPPGWEVVFLPTPEP